MVCRDRLVIPFWDGSVAVFVSFDGYVREPLHTRVVSSQLSLRIRLTSNTFPCALLFMVRV